MKLWMRVYSCEPCSIMPKCVVTEILCSLSEGLTDLQERISKVREVGLSVKLIT